MNSCLWLERGGIWRYATTGIILATMTAPSWPLVAATFGDDSSATLSDSFIETLVNGAIVAFATAIVALATGWPLGTIAALYAVRGRRWLLAAVAFPLLVPTFLWAIGWVMLAGHWPVIAPMTAGYVGCVLSFSAPAFALSFFAAYISTCTLTQSQLDAARLAGGERTVFILACKSAAVPAGLSTALAAVLSLSDPGPGQIFSVRTAASEILVSFSAMYDFKLAARQCIVLAGVVLAIAVPLAILAAPRIAAAAMAKQVRGAAPSNNSAWSTSTACAACLILAVLVAAPLAGLLLPLATATDFGRAWTEVKRAIGNTLFYGAAAGCLAATLGFVLAISIGRSRKLLTVALLACFVLFSLPTALGNLGIIRLATRAPAEWDIVLRSRFTVAVAMALHLAPIAAVLTIRAWHATSPSWTLAAAVHGVPQGQYWRNVLARVLAPSFGLCILLVALLATADVSTVLLLHPPGGASLPLSIFTVMANAPESFVASLCLAYVVISLISLVAIVSFARRLSP